jgi:hypothetical protein
VRSGIVVVVAIRKPQPFAHTRIDDTLALSYLRAAMDALHEVDPNTLDPVGKMMYAQSAAAIATSVYARDSRADLDRAQDYLQTIASHSR